MRNIRIWATLLLAICFLVLLHLSTLAQCNFRVIGHRGGSSYTFPENTLYSLRQGFLEDIYAAEIDIRYTSDSVLMLMHDYYIDRTTNATGNIADLPYSFMSTLDAGSWKGSQFAGEKVPTLVEALQLAKQYNKKLHLNMKVFVPNLIKKTLEQANAPQSMIIVDPSELYEVISYHTYLPGTPQLFFGNPPADVNDSTFYIALRDNGVFAAEIPADDMGNSSKPYIADYQRMLKKYGMELWVYTVNSPEYMRNLLPYHIDGMETDRPSQSRQIYCGNGEEYFYPEKRITGQWDFMGSLKGTIGSQITYLKDSVTEPSLVTYGKTDEFGIPRIKNVDVSVAKIDALGPKDALRFYSNFFTELPPSAQDCSNSYTVLFDLLKPHSTKDYISLLQTSNNNSDDGDLFIDNSNNSVGILGQYHGSFQDSTWNRFAFVFDLPNNKLDKYMNGTYIGTTTITNGLNGRFCMNNNWGVQSSNFLSDNDGETSTLFVSCIQLRNYAMTSAEIQELGGVEPTKIKDSIDVALSECPHLLSQSNDTLVNAQSTLQLSVKAAENVNYRWEINKTGVWENITAENIKNIGTGIITITNIPLSMDNVQFRCKMSNNCSVYSNPIKVNVSSTTHVNSLAKRDIQVYPNPSEGKLFIEHASEPISIALYNMQGMQVYSRQINSSESLTELDMTDLDGVYMLHIQTSTSLTTKRVVFIKG